MAMIAGLQIFNVIIFITFFLMVFIPLCFLQAHLSKKANKWLGLIIPFVKIFISLLFIMFAYLSMASNLDDPRSLQHPIRTILFMGGIFNIPTIVYLIIYFVCRSKIKQKGEIEKMQIRDL